MLLIIKIAEMQHNYQHTQKDIIYIVISSGTETVHNKINFFVIGYGNMWEIFITCFIYNKCRMMLLRMTASLLIISGHMSTN